MRGKPLWIFSNLNLTFNIWWQPIATDERCYMIPAVQAPNIFCQPRDQSKIPTYLSPHKSSSHAFCRYRVRRWFGGGVGGRHTPKDNFAIFLFSLMSFLMSQITLNIHAEESFTWSPCITSPKYAYYNLHKGSPLTRLMCNIRHLTHSCTWHNNKFSLPITFPVSNWNYSYNYGMPARAPTFTRLFIIEYSRTCIWFQV